MTKLMRWLDKEPSNRQLWLFAIGGLIVLVLYNLIAVQILRFFSIDTPTLPNNQIPIFVWYFPFLIIAVAIGDEAMFRMPLFLIAYDLKRSGWILVAAIGSSIVSGLLHMGVHHGDIYHFLVFGIGSFIYSLIFLKCCGLHRQPYKAFMVTSAIHIAYNTIVILVAITNGATHI